MSDTVITARPGSHSVEITREFDAPAALVFRAYTDPDLVAQWLGPRRLTMKVDNWTLHHAGGYRYIHTDPEGGEYTFRGVFHGTPSLADGIIQTFEFEGMPGDVALEKIDFTEHNGRTTVHSVSVGLSVEARDQHIANGMEHGIRDSMDRLAEVLKTIEG
ncbi:SRPBCC family protein [Actinokineospora sp. NBRC 105648]|uniref:SRPBCC family protein n=1 Tax=Actinokineospora sp. NBRC 105648 TaxID=3032206 RepID=UPI0024A54F08|nr:SRPBCC family protein [Actinokineospora sp. NBRC 105648]GLZ39414.1 ATPase [Actinokineospora sp. NBRC 105648]